MIPIPERGPLGPALAFLRTLGRTITCWLPLTTAHGRLGVLNFGSSNATDYPPDIVAFMEQIAAHVAVAVDNSMNFDRLQRSQEELTAERDQLRLLLNLNSLLITKHDLRAVVTTVSESIQPVMPHTTVGLALYEPGTQVLCSSVLCGERQTATAPPAVVLNERSPFAIALQRGGQASTPAQPERHDARPDRAGAPRVEWCGRWTWWRRNPPRNQADHTAIVDGSFENPAPVARGPGQVPPLDWRVQTAPAVGVPFRTLAL